MAEMTNKTQQEAKTTDNGGMMSLEQAVSVLLQAAEMGRKAGVYSFKDSSAIWTAMTSAEYHLKQRKGNG